MLECNIRPEQNRRYQQISAAFFLTYLALSQTLLHLRQGPLRLAVAGVCGAAFFAMLVGAGLRIRAMRDEFQRVLLTQSFVWATVITMGFATVWGFVETFSHGTVPHFPVILVPAVLILTTAAAKVFIFRNHKSPAE